MSLFRVITTAKRLFRSRSHRPKTTYWVATRAGYRNHTRSLSVSPDEDLSLNLSLKPVVGLIKLTVTPPGASLFVDNQALGDANQTLELNARAHELRVELPGYASYETKVIPQPGLPQQLNIVMLTEEAARVHRFPNKFRPLSVILSGLLFPKPLVWVQVDGNLAEDQMKLKKMSS